MSSGAAAQPKPRRRWLRRGLIGALLLAVLIWFAPAIIANTGLKNVILRRATAALQGTVSVSRLSLNWLSPVILDDVKIVDAAGEHAATVAKVATSKTLWQLLTDQFDFGTVTIHNAEVVINVTPGETTNWEEILKNYLKPASTESSRQARPAIRLIVTDSMLTLTETGQPDTTWQIPSGSVTFSPANGPIEIQAQIVGPGQLTAQLSLGESISGQFKAEQFQLKALQTLLRRFAKEVELSGELTADLAAHQEGEETRLAGKVQVAQLVHRGPWLAGDALALDRVDLPLSVVLTQQSVSIHDARLTCDVGSMSLQGTLPRTMTIATLTTAAGLEASADLNLARLGTMLPKLIHLKPGISLQEGRVVAKLKSQSSAEGTKWTGSILTSSLRGRRDGQHLRWEEPLEVHFSGTWRDGVPDFELLTCRSDFIGLAARGTISNFTARANIFLDVLSKHLDEFLDLDGLNLAGRAELSIDTQPHDQGQAVQISAQLQDVVVQQGPKLWLHEPKLEFKAQCRGVFKPGEAFRVGSLKGSVLAAGDQLSLELTESIPDLAMAERFPSRFQLLGELSRWQQRLGLFAPLPADLQMSGQAQLAGTATLSVKHAIPFDLAGEVNRFIYGSPKSPIWSEPWVKLQAAGHFNIAQDAIEVGALNILRDGVTLEARGSLKQLSTVQDLDLSGFVSYDLVRLEPDLRPYLGEGSQLRGASREALTIRARLGEGNVPMLQKLDAASQLTWQSLRAYGFEVGPAKSQLNLRNGLLKSTPIQATFGGGAVRAEPTLNIVRSDYPLSLVPGLIIDKARLTPQACASALGYALPPLANATQADGTISLDLEQNRFPLMTPTLSQFAGRLQVHEANVAPGPLVSQLVAVFVIPEPRMRLAREQVVPIRMDQGRVFHENFQFRIGGTDFTSTGSVGVDGTMNLVIDTPIPGRWLDQLNKFPAVKQSVSKQRLKLPVTGTLTKPMLDVKALDARAGQIIQESLKNLKGDLLQKGADRLLEELFKKK